MSMSKFDQFPMFLYDKAMSIWASKGGFNTYRCVRIFVIYMDEGPANIWQSLQLILKRLADVVRFPKRGIAIHHNVNFDKILLEKLLVDVNHGNRIATHWPALGNDMKSLYSSGSKRTYMVGSNGIDFFNDFVKCCCLVNQQLQEFVWRRFPCK